MKTLEERVSALEKSMFEQIITIEYCSECFVRNSKDHRNSCPFYQAPKPLEIIELSDETFNALLAAHERDPYVADWSSDYDNKIVIENTTFIRRANNG